MIYFLGLHYSSSKKNDADWIRQEKDAVRTQPIAAPKSTEGPVQSSYGSVIQVLHTDVSLAAQASQSASPVSKVPEEQVDAAITATETKKDDETMGETQTSATEVTDALAVKAPTELAAAKEETEAQITDTLEKEDKAGKPKLMVHDATAEGPADEQHGAHVDTLKEVAENNTEKRPAEADKNEDSAETNRKKEASEVDLEKEELKTPVQHLPVIDTLHATEPVLNNSAMDELEVKELLTPMDMAQNSVDTLLPENSSAEPLVSLSEPSCKVEKTLAIEKSIADKVLENHEEHVVSNMTEMKEESLPRKTQETSEQESSPAVKISAEPTVTYIENGQVNDLTCDLKDGNPAEVNVEVPQLIEISPIPCEEPSPIENQELMCEPPAGSKR